MAPAAAPAGDEAGGAAESPTPSPRSSAICCWYLPKNSSLGSDAKATPQRDKVTLYSSIVGNHGTGDIWAINPLVRLEPASGEYTAQGIEMDVDNFNDHRGDAPGADGLAPPNVYGVAITGAGRFRSTAAVAVMGARHMWNRGVVGCAAEAVDLPT